MSLKVITIDFWNTLFDSSGGKHRNALRYHTIMEEISHLGTLVTDENLDLALKASWEFFNNIWINQQRTPKPVETIEFFWSFLKLPYSKTSIDKVTQVFSDSILNYPPKMLINVGEVLPILASKYKLGIVSDTGFTPGTTLQKLMQDNGILQYFTSFSFSDETGVSKPHPKAFHRVLNEFGVKASEALHIGDIEKTDIKGAKELAMMAIKFSGDPTTTHRDADNLITIADAEVFDWIDIPHCIELLEKKKGLPV
ncbi:MAG: hypothetical protein CVV22_01840 [Ignavibacteriae bacterium HGW-Ignavibacteriae-1]|jgi:putative hydrolase of the HAD superfamily|nr:MAG: hypothetical protein CVV22_01840 [Ignavibacteriae bacterium HGW-Ignavibacteriae-1]